MRRLPLLLVAPLLFATTLAASDETGQRLRAFPELVARADALDAQLVARDDGFAAAGPRALEVVYPAEYGGAYAVAGAGQRVTVRPLAGAQARATASRGRVAYAGAYEATDVVHLVEEARSEELLILRNPAAPRVFEYELAAMTGVKDVVLREGAIHFLGEDANAHLMIERPWLIDAKGTKSSEAVRWEIAGGGKILRLTVDPAGLAYPIAVDPSFTIYTAVPTRANHASAMLLDGRVLLCGGLQFTANSFAQTTTATCVLYHAGANIARLTGQMITARSNHSMTLLANGKVLIAGGVNLTSAELWNPATTSSAPTGSLNIARFRFTATRLLDGRVLIVGGTSQPKAEIYDPAAGTFTLVANSMTTSRGEHTATLLPDGRVVIIGGSDQIQPGQLKSVEIFDPAVGGGTFTAAGELVEPHGEHTATLLANGLILVAGGIGIAGGPADELYNPATMTSSVTRTLHKYRPEATATLLGDGRVLIAGGRGTDQRAVAETEIYDPASNSYSSPGNMNLRRAEHTANKLADGRVLLAYGETAVPCSGSPCVYPPPLAPASTDTYELFNLLTPLYPTITGSTPNPSSLGQPATFTIAMPTATPPPTGTLTLYDATTAIGSVTVNGGGTYQITGTPTNWDTREMYAGYSGDANYSAGSSARYLHEVGEVTPPPALDFNGDGRDDIMWLNTRTGQVQQWIMSADGRSRTVGASLTLDDRFWRMGGTGDFNGDHIEDVVYYHRFSRQVYVFTMSGTAIVSATMIGTMNTTRDHVAAVGDFDGDGDADLVIQEYKNTNLRYWRMSGLTRQAIEAPPNPSDSDWKIVAAADFNNDHKDDLLWQHRLTGQVAVWLMNGSSRTGSATLGTPDSTNWRVAGAADFTGDDKVDILWQHLVTGQVAVWVLNNLSVTSGAVLYTISDPYYRIQSTGDYNGDGKTDILWESDYTGFVYIWLMNNLSIIESPLIATFPSPRWLADGVTDTIEAARPIERGGYGFDLNVDDRTDMVWYERTSGLARAWLMNNTNPPQESQVSMTNYRPIAAGDFDRNGSVDLAFFREAESKVKLLRQECWQSSCPPPVEHVVPAGFKLTGSGDFDGDDHMDLLFVHPATQQVLIWLMSDERIRASMVVSSLDSPDWRVAAVTDMTRDGRHDILWQNLTSGMVVLWAMEGFGITPVVIATDSPAWRIGAAGDFNRDGQIDLMRQNLSTREVSIWFMNGTTIVQTAPVLTLDDNEWRLQGSGDFNADGYSDVAFKREDTNQVALWIMSGSLVATGSPLFGPLNDATRPAGGDWTAVRSSFAIEPW